MHPGRPVYFLTEFSISEISALCSVDQLLQPPASVLPDEAPAIVAEGGVGVLPFQLERQCRRVRKGWRGCREDRQLVAVQNRGTAYPAQIVGGVCCAAAVEDGGIFCPQLGQQRQISGLRRSPFGQDQRGQGFVGWLIGWRVGCGQGGERRWRWRKAGRRPCAGGQQTQREPKHFGISSDAHYTLCSVVPALVK